MPIAISAGIDWGVAHVLFFGTNLRLAHGKEDRKHAKQYIDRATRAIVLQAAATAWTSGVPWAEALQISERAIAKANPDPAYHRRRRR